MADNTVYVDGNLDAHENLETGANWSYAYLGAAGLQTALDAVNDGNNTDMFIRNTFDLTGTIDIDAGAGDKATNKWLRVIGCDASGDELTLGNYVTLTAGGAGTYTIMDIGEDLDNVELRHLRLYNNSQGVGYDGIFIDANGFGGIMRNILINACKIEKTHSGITTEDDVVALTIVDTIITNVVDYGIAVEASMGKVLTVIGCDIQVAATKTCISLRCSATILNTILRDGAYGINDDFGDAVTIANCIFYKQTTSGIVTDETDSLINEYNNIYIYANQGDYYTNDGDGSIGYSDYGFVHFGAEAVNNPHPGPHSINNKNPWFVDGDNGDFRLKPTSPALNTGKPTLGNSLTNTGYSTIGTFGRISYLRYNQNG